VGELVPPEIGAAPSESTETLDEGLARLDTLTERLEDLNRRLKP
jgi:hypothetical protein